MWLPQVASEVMEEQEAEDLEGEQKQVQPEGTASKDLRACLCVCVYACVHALC